jgi:hypothetical protein
VIAADVCEMLAAENAELRDELETAKWYRPIAKEAIEQIRLRDLEIERQRRQLAHQREQLRWQVKKQIGASEDLVSIGLLPEKQNDGDRLQPVGLEFEFTPARIHVRSTNLADVDGLSDRLPLSVRIAHALKRGPMTAAALADELNAKLDSVIKAVNRNKTFTRINSADGIAKIALVERRVA